MLSTKSKELIKQYKLEDIEFSCDTAVQWVVDRLIEVSLEEQKYKNLKNSTK